MTAADCLKVISNAKHTSAPHRAEYRSSLLSEMDGACITHDNIDPSPRGHRRDGVDSEARWFIPKK
jgi:hypothetical protein